MLTPTLGQDLKKSKKIKALKNGVKKFFFLYFDYVFNVVLLKGSRASSRASQLKEKMIITYKKNRIRSLFLVFLSSLNSSEK